MPEVRGITPPKKIGDRKTSKFLRDYIQLCNLIANIWNAIRYRPSENGVAIANYDHSCICSVSLVNCGKQMAKIGQEF